jgi:flagella basal body P-ring formation protein FlgA
MLTGALTALALLMGRAPAHASDFDPVHSVRRLLAAERGRLPGRVEIELAAAEKHLARAPCRSPEPYVPAGGRLWGRGMLGWRCGGDAPWSLLLPVNIRVYAPALVAARTLGAQQPVSAADVQLREIELTKAPPGVLLDARETAGLVTAHAVTRGTVLRRDHFRAPLAVAAGEQVRVVYVGTGFSISTFGKSLQAGSAGQLVRVQLESGRVLGGLARPGHRVEVAF